MKGITAIQEEGIFTSVQWISFSLHTLKGLLLAIADALPHILPVYALCDVFPVSTFTVYQHVERRILLSDSIYRLHNAPMGVYQYVTCVLLRGPFPQQYY